MLVLPFQYADFLSARASGQGAPIRKPAGLMVGRVIDVTTNRPIGGALVSLNSAGMSDPRAPLSSGSVQVIADDQGRFLFRDLAKGTYALSAVAPGHLSGGYGQRRPGGLARPF